MWVVWIITFLLSHGDGFSNSRWSASVSVLLASGAMESKFDNMDDRGGVYTLCVVFISALPGSWR